MNREAFLVLELNTRCLLRDLSDAAGQPITLANLPGVELERWRALGFTHIWFMGVWDTGPLARAVALAHPAVLEAGRRILPGFSPADILGSPYAISRYEVAGELGGAEGLRSLRVRLHEAGLKLILDFVPNHLGIDHSWIHDDPDLFVQGTPKGEGAFTAETARGQRWIMHGMDPYFPPWIETAQLEYRNPDVRRRMTDTLVSLASVCDGLRCDLAMLLLNDVFARTWAHAPCRGTAQTSEFWSESIAAVKSVFPEFLFVAEAYWGREPDLQRLGFDYTYDKAVYDFLIARDAPGLHGYLAELSPEVLSRGVHFLENHDEARAGATFQIAAEHRSAAWLAYLLPGMKLMHEGQLDGALHRLPVQLARRPRETPNCEIRAMYDELLAFLRSTRVERGRASLVPVQGAADRRSSVIALLFRFPGKRDEMVAINPGSATERCRILGPGPAGSGDTLVELAPYEVRQWGHGDDDK